MNEGLWAEIRRLYHNNGLKCRAISRRLKVCRETVDLALASGSCPKRKPARRKSKLDPYEDTLKDILKEFPELSGVRIYEDIKKVGFEGEITILRDWLRLHRPRKQKEAFLKRESLPAEEAQADWGSYGQIQVDGVTRPLSVFVMTLSYSRLLYVEFTVSQEMEDFMRCHVNAFSYFQGCPKTILYDNLKSVVQWRQRRLTRFNARFMEFAGTYLFQPRPCNPGRGNEKPRAETAVRYVKQNFLAGRTFRDLTDIKSQSFLWLRDVANVRIHGTTRERPLDRYQREKNLLQVLPPSPYDTRICRSVIVSHQARVSFQTNMYTVPPQFVGLTLTLKASPVQVTIYQDDREVASHTRCYRRHNDIEDPTHIEAILATKKQGRVDKERDTFLALGPLAKAFVQGLVERGQGSPEFHISKALHLVSEYGETQVFSAIEKCLQFGAFGADYVQNILYQRIGKDSTPKPPNPVTLTTRPDLAQHTVEEPDLNDYEALSNMEDDDNDGHNQEP